MKQCTKCHNHYPKEFFYKKTKTTTRAECKFCWNEITKQNQLKIKKQMIEYKGGKCQKCGYNTCIGALEFHHKEKETKEYEPAKATSFNQIKKELDKCILLCANCHRETHWNK